MYQSLIRLVLSSCLLAKLLKHVENYRVINISREPTNYRTAFDKDRDHFLSLEYKTTFLFRIT